MQNTIGTVSNVNKVSNLDWALYYAARGWHVFPVHYIMSDSRCSCRSPKCNLSNPSNRIGKHPVTKTGLLEAATNEEQIRLWWSSERKLIFDPGPSKGSPRFSSPHYNIGYVPSLSGNVVMDIDVGERNGKKKVGDESLMTLLADPAHTLPGTLRMRSGSGGEHYHFSSASQIPKSEGRVGTDIDVRGSGGYVILPPSTHISCQKYEWIDDPDSVQPAELPEWLANRMMTTPATLDTLIGDDVLDPAVVEGVKREMNRLTPERIKLLLGYIDPDCDRDTWWKVGAAIWYELRESGKDIWREWSQRAPGKFNAGDLEKQWASFADKGIKAGTLVKIAKDHGFEGFDRAAAASPEIRDKYVYVRSIKRIVELPAMSELDREQFDFTLAFRFEKGKPYDHVARDGFFRRVETATYWPGNGDLIVNDEGGIALNYWKPSGVAPAPGDISPLLEHVDYLFPAVDAEGNALADVKDGRSLEARILLWYLAYQVQHPGEKIHWALLIEGDQGIGKTFFKEVMEVVLGPRNVRVINSDILHEKYTTWQRNAQLIVVEEMMAQERRELMNKLKTMITERWCSIRDMYRPPYEQPNRFNFLFFTNHKDSILIDNTDRRYCILKTAARPRSVPEYYAPLFAWVRRSGPALLNWLQHHDVSEFHPKAHAPMTSGKRDLIFRSMPAIDQYIRQHVEAREWPCLWELLNPGLLVPFLAKVNIRATPKQVEESFERLGYLDLGKRRTGQGDNKVQMWAVRQMDLYRAMDAGQLRQVWIQQVKNTPPEVSNEDAGQFLPSGAKTLEKLEAM